MSKELTIDDVYEIASEVAENTVKTFLSNLVKLVPSAEATVDAIRDAQYRELKKLKKSKNVSYDDYEDESEEEDYEDFEEEEAPTKKLKESAKRNPVSLKDLVDDDADFAAIAHPATANESPEMNIDAALSQITLERSDLFEAAATSEIEPCTVNPGQF